MLSTLSTSSSSSSLGTEIQGRKLKYDAGVITVDDKEVAIKGEFKIHFPLRRVTIDEGQLEFLTQRIGTWFRNNYKGTRTKLNTTEQLMAAVRWSLCCAPQSWTNKCGRNLEENIEKLDLFTKMCIIYFLLDDTMDELMGEEGYRHFCEFAGSLTFDIAMGKFGSESEFREKWAASLGGRMWASFYPDFYLTWLFFDELLQKYPSSLAMDVDAFEWREFMLAIPAKRFLESTHWMDVQMQQKFHPIRPSTYDFYAVDRAGLELVNNALVILEGIQVTRQMREQRHLRRLEHLSCLGLAVINDLLGLRKDILDNNPNTKYHAYRNEGGLEFDQILRKMETDLQDCMMEFEEIYHYLAGVYDGQTELMKYVEIIVGHVSGLLSYHMDNSRYYSIRCEIE